MSTGVATDPLSEFRWPPLPAPAGRTPPLEKVSREYLEAVREQLRKAHRSGASGQGVVETYTRAVDELVTYLFMVATVGYVHRHGRLSRPCAVFAQGGYGRGELNPCSDVDLLFVYSWKINPYVEIVAETLLYSLWGARVSVGHAMRHVRECVRLAETDLRIKTALLDARYLCGEGTLRDEFHTAMAERIVKRNPARFLAQIAGNMEERHQQQGGSVYLLEPHLKDGRGGLRDLQTALWAGKVAFKISTFSELVVKGVVSARDLAEAEASRDFLWRVRNALHFLTGTHTDRLSFTYQDTVAGELGYGSSAEFMRAYYENATVIARFARMVVDRSRERPQPGPLAGWVRSREIRDGVRIAGGQIVVAGPEIVRRDPANLVLIFHDAQRHSVPLGESARRIVRDHLGLLSAGGEPPPGATAALLEILRWRRGVHEALVEMDQLGVLGQLIPEWRRLRWLIQRDAFHVYTVDEHCLMGVRELERLRAGEHKESAPLLTQVVRDIDGIEVLFLAMLFHDLGKGYGDSHSQRGAAQVRAIAVRLGLNQDDAEQLEWLVGHHLLMSHLAQNRDVHDDTLVADFARTLGSVDTLKKLYLLTFADMRAVAPSVWNNWRDLLVGDLYMRTLDMLERGTFEPEDRRARVARVRRRVLDAAAGLDVDHEQLAAFLDRMPDSYLLSTPEGVIPHHWLLATRVADGAPLASALRHFPDKEFSEFTVCTRDRPGLFAMISGVLAARALNVVSARIATSSDGIALDVFRVSHLDKRELVLEPERWERVRLLLEEVLRGERDVAALVAASDRRSVLRPLAPPSTPTRVVVDNEASRAYTVLDVYTHDRVGVLYAITSALHELGLLIHVAKITTSVGQVLDVFYVTDEGGQKVTDGERLGAIERVVEARLCERGEGAAAAKL